eukprot:GEMP01062698.1.p1 GENE.GEMP01062698.1~~GEMP01062698.1.p1  ORF type:complete len:244 (-),score=19.00 GEMP01062698.1:626-1357(-)
MSLARYLGALTVCYGGAGTEQELPPPLLPKDAIYESMPRPQQFWRLPPYLHAHLEYIYSTDVTDEHVRFLPRLREVHIGGAHNLMRGGKLYRSGHPVFLSYPGDMIVWSSDSPFGRLTAHERDMTALRRRYPNMKLLINLNLRPFADGTEAFLGTFGGGFFKGRARKQQGKTSNLDIISVCVILSLNMSFFCRRQQMEWICFCCGYFFFLCVFQKKHTHKIRLTQRNIYAGYFLFVCFRTSSL